MPEFVYLDTNDHEPFTNLDMTIFYRFELNGRVHVLPYLSFYEIFSNRLRQKHFKNYDKACLVSRLLSRKRKGKMTDEDFDRIVHSINTGTCTDACHQMLINTSIKAFRKFNMPHINSEYGLRIQKALENDTFKVITNLDDAFLAMSEHYHNIKAIPLRLYAVDEIPLQSHSYEKFSVYAKDYVLTPSSRIVTPLPIPAEGL